jgi:thiamine biosynthesis lipoprotein
MVGMSTVQEHAFNTRLMGCDAAVSIVTDDFDRATIAFERAIALGRATEARFSRFLPDSELSTLNREKTNIVSPEFMRALMTAFSLYQETQQVFNVLTQVRARGYSSDFDHMEREVTIGVPLPYNSDLEQVIVDEDTRLVVLRADQELDFGGFMKGHTAEVLAQSMTDMQGVIVNIGGDCYATGRDAQHKPFMFSVYNPITDAYPLALPIHGSGAIATSGTYRRTWRLNGAPVHHIVGVQGGSDDLVSATVVHPLGGRADAYATTAIALGSAGAVQFLDRMHTPYVLITSEGQLIRNTTSSV